MFRYIRNNVYLCDGNTRNNNVQIKNKRNSKRPAYHYQRGGEGSRIQQDFIV